MRFVRSLSLQHYPEDVCRSPALSSSSSALTLSLSPLGPSSPAPPQSVVQAVFGGCVGCGEAQQELQMLRQQVSRLEVQLNQERARSKEIMDAVSVVRQPA